MLRLHYRYPSLAWYGFACATLGAFGLVPAAFAVAAVGSMAERGVSGAMIGIGAAMATIAAAFLGGTWWAWRRIRAMHRARHAYGIVLDQGRLTSVDWDMIRPRRVELALTDVAEAAEGAYKGRRFVRIRTRQGDRYALPLQRLGAEDRDLLRTALGILPA